MLINFTKMHGLGNDFMVIDTIKQAITLSPTQIQKLSDRHFGVGFDQLLLVEKPDNPKNDFKYRIFNADGSEVEQCGNGARCFARFVIKKELTDKRIEQSISVETKKGIIELLVTDFDTVVVNMGEPLWHSKDIPFRQLKSTNATYIVEEKTVGVVSMGNPHAVLIVDDINQEIAPTAQRIQNSPDFPEGVNVNFVEIVDQFNLKLRVYERGVGETLACGSGACATVAYLDKIGKVNAGLNVIVELQGGKLLVRFDDDKNIIMSGAAEFVFEGQVEI